jgi:hypothetical protein
MASGKNKKFFESFMSEIRKENSVDDVYVARVLRKLGNGRVEVFFMDAKNRPKTEQALIRGSFRGKGKHGAWIDVSSVVIISDTGVGSAKYIIVSVLEPDQVRMLKKEMALDPRILATDNTDKESLMKGVADDMGGFVFEGGDDVETKNPLLEKEDLDDGDIDNI